MYWTIQMRDGLFSTITGAVCVGQNMYCFGALWSHMDYLDVRILNTETLRWAFVPMNMDEYSTPFHYPEVPSRKSGSTAVAYQNKIYMLGGPDAALNILFCFDTDTLRWSRPAVTGIIPDALRGNSACVAGHCMYIFCDSNNGISNTVPFIDLRTLEWKTLRAIGEPRSPLNSPVTIQERIYRIDDNFPNNAEVVYLDVNTREWHRPSTTGNGPFDCTTYSLFLFNGIIYTFGKTGLYSFDPKRNFWKEARGHGAKPTPLGKYACAVNDTKMFLLGDFVYYGIINYSEVRILDFAPKLRTLSILAVAEHKLDISCLPSMLQEEVRSQSEEDGAERKY